MRRTIQVAVILGLLGTTGIAHGQQSELAFVIQNLFGTIELDNDFHEAHFSGEQQLELINDTFVAAFAPALTTLPVGSPGGGFAYNYDPDTGVFTRASESFGSLFSERALTIGRGKWNIGLSAQSVEFDDYGSIELSRRGVNFQLLHLDTGENGRLNPFFEGDVISTQMQVDLATDSTVLVVTYGVTDKLDVSFAVPQVETQLDVEARLDILRLSSDELGSAIHGFNLNDPNLQVLNEDSAIARSSASASGIGDVLVRGKYRFRDAPGGGMAAGVDLRLATGDERKLLGTGGTQVKMFLIGSREFGRFAPLFNLGYTFSGVGGQVLDTLPDEINYSVGFAIAAGQRFTINGDLVGRRLLDAPGLRQSSDDFFFAMSNGGEVFDTRLPTVDRTIDDQDISFGSIGFRLNPKGSLLISANAIFSLSDDGLIDQDVIPVFSIDYSF